MQNLEERSARAQRFTANRAGKTSGEPSSWIPRSTLGVSAKIEQGVVTLTLPKAEQVKPRKIAVS